MHKTLFVLLCALALAFVSVSVWAQTAPLADVLKVDYFANANTAGAPDGTLRIDNPGTSGTNLCAAIYVFDSAQEMSECCSCLETPDGLRTLSVNGDLTSNPLTGVTLANGLIKIVSTRSNGTTCPNPTNLFPTAAVRAWETHIQNVGFAITETASQDATFSSTEQRLLQSECYAIHLTGSGKGICSCGTGD